jgi:hypothetical protein
MMYFYSKQSKSATKIENGFKTKINKNNIFNPQKRITVFRIKKTFIVFNNFYNS